MKRQSQALSPRALLGLRADRLPQVLVVLAALALSTGRSPSLSAGGLPEVVALPPERPGTIFYFGEGVIPPPEGQTVHPNPDYIASAGDVDGDGFEDLLCNAIPEALGSWIIFLIYGQPSPPGSFLLDGRSDHVSVIRFFDEGLHAGRIIRPGLAAAGDLDKDGFDDFLISVPYEQLVFLFFGSPELRGTEIELPIPQGLVTWHSKKDTIGGGPPTHHGIAVINDFNGDGFPEFALAAPFENNDNGRVYVASWRPELRTAGVMDVEELGDAYPGYISEGFSLDGAPAKAGNRVSSAGDINSDGLDDLCIGYHETDFFDVIFGSSDRIRPTSDRAAG